MDFLRKFAGFKIAALFAFATRNKLRQSHRLKTSAVGIGAALGRSVDRQRIIAPRLFGAYNFGAPHLSATESKFCTVALDRMPVLPKNFTCRCIWYYGQVTGVTFAYTIKSPLRGRIGAYAGVDLPPVPTALNDESGPGDKSIAIVSNSGVYRCLCAGDRGNCQSR